MAITNYDDITNVVCYFLPNDSGSITESADQVSQIDDQSANNFHEKQATADDQPLTNQVSKNGLNVLDFDGATQFMKTDAFGEDFSQPNTSFAFFRITSSSGYRFITDGITDTKRHGVLRRDGTGDWQFYAGTAARLTDVGPDLDWHTIIVIFDGASTKIYEDGSLLDTVDAGTEVIDGFTVGCHQDEFSFMEGQIGDFGLYSKALSGSEITDIDVFMREQYGLLVSRTITDAVCTPGDTLNVITFGDAIGATSYDIFWSTLPSVDTDDTRIVGVTSGHNHTGLSNGTQYYYAVVGLNDAGESVLSNEVSGTPAASGSPPDAPANPLCVIGNAQNTISWDAPADTDSYKLYWSLIAVVTIEDNEIILGDVLTYNHTGRTNGTDYFYAVLAVNEHGDGDLSTEVSGKPIAPPANLLAVPGSASQENDITWDASTGATSYNIFFDTSPGVTKSATELIGVTSPYTHTGITNDQIYYYRVEAVNADGDSDLSNEDDATPFGIPSAPGGVVATPGDTQNIISFNNSVSATSYNIYHNPTSPVTTAHTKITGVTSPHAHTGLPNDVEVFYIVTAENVRGESVASSEVSGTPTEPPPLPTDNNDGNHIILAAQYILGG